jgi:hypothetical protein
MQTKCCYYFILLILFSCSCHNTKTDNNNQIDSNKIIIKKDSVKDSLLLIRNKLTNKITLSDSLLKFYFTKNISSLELNSIDSIKRFIYVVKCIDFDGLSKMIINGPAESLPREIPEKCSYLSSKSMFIFQYKTEATAELRYDYFVKHIGNPDKILLQSGGLVFTEKNNLCILVLNTCIDKNILNPTDSIFLYFNKKRYTRVICGSGYKIVE